MIYYMGPGDGSQVVRVGGKCLYLRNRLLLPLFLSLLGSHCVAQDGLELTAFFNLSLLRVRMTGMSYHSRLNLLY